MSPAADPALDPKKRSLLAYFGTAVALCSLLYAGVNHLMGFAPGVGIMAGNGLCLLANQLWIPRLRTARQYRALAMVQTAICFAAVSYVTYYSGGIHSPLVVWIALAPVAATLLFGLTRHTVFWLVVTLCTVSAFGLLPWLGIQPPVRYNTDLTELFFVNSLLGFVLLLFTLVQFFERTKNQAFREVESQNRELRMANERVESAYAAKSRFLTAASHDLRQPAHALGMFVARLSELHHARNSPLDEWDGTRAAVQGVSASTQALQELLDVLFDYSRLESQPSGNPLRPVCVNSIFQQLHLLCGHSAATKGLHLRIRPTRAWVMSDPVLLQRVLLNLVNNAIKYTPQGTVLVCCRPAAQGRQAQIQVWDSGIGIDAPLHQTVFEEFFQVENPERDHAKGLGLGLSMVERSCRLLQHTVALRSGLGCGSRFTVSAEATAPRPRQPLLSAPDESADSTSVQGREVWLIEDNLLGGQALRGMLQSWGCNTRLFESPALAREAVAAGLRPDFIISDYRLREQETGIATILALRELLQHKVPACLITGDLQEEVRHHAHSAGLVLLKKPLQPAKLRSLLRRSLAPAPQQAG